MKKGVTMKETDKKNLKQEFRELSYICFCRSTANENKPDTLCSACRRQIQITKLLEMD